MSNSHNSNTARLTFHTKELQPLQKQSSWNQHQLSISPPSVFKKQKHRPSSASEGVAGPMIGFMKSRASLLKTGSSKSQVLLHKPPPQYKEPMHRRQRNFKGSVLTLLNQVTDQQEQENHLYAIQPLIFRSVSSGRISPSEKNFAAMNFHNLCVLIITDSIS